MAQAEWRHAQHTCGERERERKMGRERERETTSNTYFVLCSGSGAQTHTRLEKMDGEGGKEGRKRDLVWGQIQILIWRTARKREREKSQCIET